MNMHLQRQHEMLVRARDFRAANRDAIAASSIAVRVFDDLDACIARIDRLREDEISQDGNLRKLTTAKRFAYVAVLKRMRAAAVASRAMPHGVGSPTARRMPPKRSIGEFIRTALAETDTLAEFADVYRQRGLPDDFVARLRDDINALEDVKRRKDAQASNAVGNRIGLRLEIKRGFDLVRQLDGIVLHLFADDDAALGAWKTARRVDWWQRAGRKKPVRAEG